ncbi:putative ankyrin repeat protein RF_0381 [Diabrotica virgifera virgifera]|uniref:Uncharacterized protein LOC114327145 n=1 Tax=Diabrotica virgifera virgifera TaxID=50390 RepID=A0A6P7F7I4_DIAVI|nr:putative ankyrin repeat protein RF_0381 [Diabrotica virgifera virgifera]XP_028131465.1 putative ankyrin repeat protein RF_0381 [Diabrotica virgifera virgifera]XP_028131466.1 putative ankyrin repeat protein RF_0381 [Diabrotica virgifera virgifera]XP_028131467.1 putative ankyrin repeat protein RF_0381 [Diabrotica virgifera virgifera]
MIVSGAKARSLLREIQYGTIDKIKLAYKNEINIECYGSCRSVLNWATHFGKDYIVRKLLKNKKLIKNTDLDTSLHIAALEGYTTLVKLLIKHGADIEFENDDGETPLLLAIKSNEGYNLKDVDSLVNILIENEADVNASDNGLNTSLHMACQMGLCSIVELLLDAGADINLQNGTGWTPLFCAAYYNRLCIVKLLLHRGADVTITDDESGDTALHMCVKCDKVAVTELLLQNGADVTSRNEDGYDIFDLVNNVFETNITNGKKLVRSILYSNINTPIPERHNSGNFSRFWDACKSELELMKACKIAESNISYNQLLLERNNSKLAAFLSNADIVSELSTLDYKKKFPIYEDYIAKNISKGERRLHVYYEADQIMNNFSPFLPIMVRRKIYNYLSNSDFAAFKLSMTYKYTAPSYKLPHYCNY